MSDKNYVDIGKVTRFCSMCGTKITYYIRPGGRVKLCDYCENNSMTYREVLEILLLTKDKNNILKNQGIPLFDENNS